MPGCSNFFALDADAAVNFGSIYASALHRFIRVEEKAVGVTHTRAISCIGRRLKGVFRLYAGQELTTMTLAQ